MANTLTKQERNWVYDQLGQLDNIQWWKDPQGETLAHMIPGSSTNRRYSMDRRDELMQQVQREGVPEGWANPFDNPNNPIKSATSVRYDPDTDPMMSAPGGWDAYNRGEGSWSDRELIEKYGPGDADGKWWPSGSGRGGGAPGPGVPGMGTNIFGHRGGGAPGGGAPGGGGSLGWTNKGISDFKGWGDRQQQAPERSGGMNALAQALAKKNWG